jgi:SAM-dependent methyltransferase
MTGVTEGAKVLDVGCGQLGLRALEPEMDVTGLDVLAQPDYPGPFVQGDPAAGLPFADGEFDLAYCNSVIEHVPPERREAFAAELRRVARGWYVQTPAWSFPIEPHALLPGAHWLPAPWRRHYWKLGAAGSWEDISLLRKGELEELFGGPVLREGMGRLAKSWISIRRIPREP